MHITKKIQKEITIQSNKIKEITIAEDLPKSHKRIEGIINNNSNNNNNKAAYKAEIINIAEYLNTKYKEYQFVNIVTVHESTQPNMNSILKSAAKII